MSGKLRLGPLPKTESIRMTVTLSVAVKADLDRYADVYGAAYGELVDAAALIPHMVAAFMERDRAFRRARQEARPGSDAIRTGASIKATKSNTNAAAGDTSMSE